MDIQRVALFKPDQIITDSVYPLATLDERAHEHFAFVISRYWPRGLKSSRGRAGIDGHAALLHWERALAPSAELLRSYKEREIAWVDFAAAYRHEVAPYLDEWWRVWAYWQLRRKAPGTKILLLCYERLGAEHGPTEATVHCHRRLLREMLLATRVDARIIEREIEREREGESIQPPIIK